MSASGPGFSDIVLSCIDRALNIVGGSGKQVVYEALEDRYGIGRDQIPEHPEYLIKVMKIYLGRAGDAVEKEALIWIKEASGVSSSTLLDAIEELRMQYSTAQLTQEPTIAPQAKWQLESQSSVPEATQEGTQPSYRYSAKFSFGPAPQKKQEDPESREALEVYLRSIVERHLVDKKRVPVE